MSKTFPPLWDNKKHSKEIKSARFGGLNAKIHGDDFLHTRAKGLEDQKMASL